MKKNSLFLAAIAVLSFAFAKAQDANDCTVMLQIYAENAKARSYDEAYKQLGPLVENCPDFHAAIYQYGERIYDHRLKNSIGEESDNAKGLIAMLEAQISKFPEQVNVSKKQTEIARTMYKYNIGTEVEQFEMLKTSFQSDKENFTDPNAMMIYFSLAQKDYGAGNMDLQGFFDIYDELVAQIEKVQDERGQIITTYMDKDAAGTLTDEERAQMEAQETNIKNYGIVMGSVNATLGELADCEKLIPLYEAEFENKKNDENWLSNVLKRLGAKECTDAPLYIASVKALHDLRPSAKTAYGLGNIAKTNSEKLKYWNQALELGVSNDIKSIIHYKKGLLLKDQGQYGSAKREFIASNAARPSFGNPFLQIANMIGNSANSCGDSVFEKRAVNWLAAQYAYKAAAVDPSLRSTATQTAASYNGRAPQKNDIFMNENYNSGQTISFGCWIGESVRIP